MKDGQHAVSGRFPVWAGLAYVLVALLNTLRSRIVPMNLKTFNNLVYR